MNPTTATIVADPHDAPHAHGQGHGHGHHDPHLAHHFDSTEQQFEADKLGMWVFLVTEILFFSGLFCAYAVYRSNHPEIFEYAHLFLNRTLGAVNTVILLFSSLTMAWGVRCAQLSQARGLRICLILTLLCAFGFLGIKYVEYKTKWEEGLLWGERYKPTEEALAHIAAHGAHDGGEPAPHGEAKPGHSTGEAKHAAAPIPAPDHVSIFFGIYFCMTGLHGIHILVGIGLISWLLVRSFRGEFTDGYFTPVDLVGLYWHIVDLVWIYLFPLLYLIH
jgi:cytochrome c oxidase subunit 3